jgi:hypothetical protein
MRLLAHSVWRREVVAALVRMPEAARALVLQRCVVVVSGGSVNGQVFGSRWFADADFLIVLSAREGIGETLMHEVGHLVAGGPDGPESERAAARLARAWGAAGDSADPEGCAQRFVAEAAAPVRARLEGGELRLECGTCASACEVVAPTVPGLAAEVGASCPRCGWFDVVSLSNISPCTCGSRATVVWTEQATAAEPTAAWTCTTCGEVVTRELRVGPDREPVPAADPADLGAWHVMHAVRVLLGVEESLRRSEPGDVMTLEANRGSLWWAKRLMMHALEEFAHGDPRRPYVEDALADLEGTWVSVSQRDLAACAATAARVARALDALAPTNTAAAAGPGATTSGPRDSAEEGER